MPQSFLHKDWRYSGSPGSYCAASWQRQSSLVLQALAWLVVGLRCAGNMHCVRHRFLDISLQSNADSNSAQLQRQSGLLCHAVLLSVQLYQSAFPSSRDTSQFHLLLLMALYWGRLAGITRVGRHFHMCPCKAHLIHRLRTGQQTGLAASAVHGRGLHQHRRACCAGSRLHQVRQWLHLAQAAADTRNGGSRPELLLRW